MIDDRIERERHQDLADVFDRALADVTAGTTRQLVCVYDGGALPTEPDRYVLTNPAYLNGIESEGGTGGPWVDTSTTIVVDVLGRAPKDGDYLTAYAIGGQWVAELTGSRKTKGCIQFRGCNGSPLEGVTVKIYDKQGGMLLAGPLTSDANGTVCPDLVAGTYWVDTTETGGEGFPLDKYVWTAMNFGIPASGSNSWPTELMPGYGCCATVNFPLPTTLFLTVCGQTYTLSGGAGGQIFGWAPIGTPTIVTDFVAVVQNCNLGGWNPPDTSTQEVPWAVRLLCPTNQTTMVGEAGVCGIGHFNGAIGGFDFFAICPGQCVGVGNAYTCCNGGAGPAGAPFTLTGTIGETVNLTGSMPGAMSKSCVFPPANPWPLPCAGRGITVTN